LKTIAVLGAGNAGCAAAAHLTQMGLTVRLYNRWEKEIEAIRAQGGVRLEGVLGSGLYPIPVITTDLKEAVREADLFWVATPAVAHEFLAAELTPLLPAGARVFLNPGSTGGALAFARAVRENGGPRDVVVAETNTNIYIGRITSPGTVSVWNMAPHILFSAFPGRGTGAMFSLLSPYFKNLKLVPTVLDTAFANINAIMHPAGVLMNAGWIEHTGGEFKFYVEGGTKSVGAIIDRLDRERMAAMTALGLDPVRFVEIFYLYGATSKEALEAGSSHLALRDSAPNALIKAPPDLRNRYISEDVPFGLVPMRHLAALAGVSTPIIDALIALASVANGVDYLTTGLTLDKMGLGRVTPFSLPVFLREGNPG
jgi:opine dehydrogenase